MYGTNLLQMKMENGLLTVGTLKHLLVNKPQISRNLGGEIPRILIQN
jgi:hypothetical protein